MPRLGACGLDAPETQCSLATFKDMCEKPMHEASTPHRTSVTFVRKNSREKARCSDTYLAARIRTVTEVLYIGTTT